MNMSSGKVINRKFTINSGPEDGANIRGNRAVTNIMITIIIQNAIMRYLNFKTNTPFKIIKERGGYVNLSRLLNISSLSKIYFSENKNE